MPTDEIVSDALDMACILLVQKGFLAGKSWQEIRQSLISACEIHAKDKREVVNDDTVQTK